MMPEHAALFQQPAPQFQRGQGMRIRGLNGRFIIESEAQVAQESEASAPTAEFVGAWYPTAVDSTHINLTAGSVEDGSNTFTPSVTNIAVHETNLNYVYLECSITPTVLNSYITSGVITAAIVKAYTTTKINTNSKAYLLLCTWQAGKLVDRYRYFSQGLKIQDTQSNTSTAASFFYPVA